MSALPRTAEAMPRLPDNFWEKRPELRIIRRAAHARMISADALLHVVLARIAAALPADLGLPPTIGGRVGMSYFVNVVSPPGTGKSSTAVVGQELLPGAPLLNAENDGRPIGSGEGLIEVMFDLVEETSADGKRKVLVKKQVRHNAVFTVDEGEVMTILGNQRSGSILLSTLRSIWTGQTIGQMNASNERKRLLLSGSYTYGLIVALQEANAQFLLDAGDVGTPQRFAWVSGIDPTIPDDPPDFPKPLTWRGDQVRHTITPESYFTLDPVVESEIRAAHLERVRGAAGYDVLDAHADLMRLKQSALLAALDRRINVTQEDWVLGGILQFLSTSTMRRLQALAAARAGEREKATSVRLAQREVTKLDVTLAHRTVECATRIRDKVTAQPGVTVADVRRVLRRWRDDFDDGLERAIQQRWVEERPEPGQGATKRALYPGRGQ